MNDNVFQEASFKTGSAPKVLNLYVSLLQKRLGGKISTPKIDLETSLKNGEKGIMMFHQKHGFRFNWNNGEITSLSIWTKPAFEPQININLKGLNAVQVLTLAEAVLRNPRNPVIDFGPDSEPGAAPVKQPPIIEEDVLNKSFKEMYTYSEMSTVARNDLMAFFQKISSSGTKVTYGNFYKQYNESGGGKATYKEVREFLDSQKRNLESRVKKGIGSPALTTKAANNLSNDPTALTKREEWMKKNTGTIDGQFTGPEVFDRINIMTKNLLKGSSQEKAKIALIIAGDPGLGKTYETVELLTKVLGERGKQWVLFKGTMSAVKLYDNLFKNNGKLIVFDDVKGPLDTTGDAPEILKAATDSNPKERFISYQKDIGEAAAPYRGVEGKIFNACLLAVRKFIRKNKEYKNIDSQTKFVSMVKGINEWIKTDSPAVTLSKTDVDTLENLLVEYEDEDFINAAAAKVVKWNPERPPSFKFIGKIIYITNKKLSQIDAAVFSRSETIDVDFTAEQVMQRIESKLAYLEPQGKLLKEKKECLAFMVDYLNNNPNYPGKLCFRKFDSAFGTWMQQGITKEFRNKWIVESLDNAAAAEAGRR